MPSGAASASIWATVSWKAAGPSAPIEIASPSRTTSATGRARTASATPGQHRGDLVQVAGVDAYLVAASVHLDADPVELPLNRRFPEARERLADIGRGRGKHRQNRPEELEAHRREPLLPALERELRRRREVAREHQRAADALRRNGRRPRDGVGHQPGERTLPQLAREEPPQERGLSRRGARQQVGEQGAATGRGPAPGRPLELGDRPVELGDGDRRRRRGCRLDAVDHPVPHADPALARRTREEADHDGHLARLEAAEQPGEQRDLLRARARAGDLFGDLDDVGEKRHAGSTNFPRRPDA